MKNVHYPSSFRRARRLKLRLKRLFDLIASLIGLFIFSPIMLFVGLAIMLSMGGPVLFCRERPGFKGIPFLFYKFRTMRDSTGPDGKPLDDAERLTGLGQCLRRSSLDELPQLYNVLKGDLSFVGPRPLLMEYLPRYSPEQGRRHDVMPGITGWAQVNGRNSISWKEKLALDVWYVDHWSLWLDVKILFMTVFSVLERKGISHPGSSTMPFFTGTGP